jgi:hypothetical protein
MNIFNPSCPGYSRGASYPLEGTGYRTYPEGLDFLPGPLIRDTTYWNRIKRNREEKNEPIPGEYVGSVIDPTALFAGKHFSNSILYNKEENDAGVYEAPYWKYNTLYSQLPKYLLLDARNAPIPQSSGRALLVMKRNDGTDYIRQSGTTDEGEFIDTYDNFARLYDEEYGSSSYRSFCAGWVPCYNVTTKEFIAETPNLEHDTVSPPPPDYPPWVITCRPWWQNKETNSEGFISSFDWIVKFDNVNYPTGAGDSNREYIFTPVAGYHWNKGAKKRADQWYDYSDPASADPEGPQDNFLNYSVPMTIGDNLEALRRHHIHHGSIDIRGTTHFLLTSSSVGQDGSSPFDAYGSIPTSHLTVSPCNP